MRISRRRLLGDRGYQRKVATWTLIVSGVSAAIALIAFALPRQQPVDDEPRSELRIQGDGNVIRHEGEGDIILGDVTQQLPLPASLIETTELDRDCNPRFDFCFSYPKTWTRSDPENGDGNSYTDPRRDAFVRIAFFGYGWSDWNPVSSEALQYVEPETIIQSREAGLHLWEWSEDSDGDLVELREQIPGHRVVYRDVTDTGSTIVMLQLVQGEGRYIVYSASAPEDLFEEYEALFNDLATDIRVLQPQWVIPGSG